MLNAHPPPRRQRQPLQSARSMGERISHPEKVPAPDGEPGRAREGPADAWPRPGMTITRRYPYRFPVLLPVTRFATLLSEPIALRQRGYVAFPFSPGAHVLLVEQDAEADLARFVELPLPVMRRAHAVALDYVQPIVELRQLGRGDVLA